MNYLPSKRKVVFHAEEAFLRGVEAKLAELYPPQAPKQHPPSTGSSLPAAHTETVPGEEHAALHAPPVIRDTSTDAQAMEVDALHERAALPATGCVGTRVHARLTLRTHVTKHTTLCSLADCSVQRC